MLLICSNNQPSVGKVKNMSFFIWLLNTGLTVYVFQVPRVFINGKSIGGNSDVKKLYDNGQLEQMVKDCQ